MKTYKTERPVNSAALSPLHDHVSLSNYIFSCQKETDIHVPFIKKYLAFLCEALTLMSPEQQTTKFTTAKFQKIFCMKSY